MEKKKRLKSDPCGLQTQLLCSVLLAPFLYVKKFPAITSVMVGLFGVCLFVCCFRSFIKKQKNYRFS